MLQESFAFQTIVVNTPLAQFKVRVIVNLRVLDPMWVAPKAFLIVK
jgi:hypothetical protein